MINIVKWDTENFGLKVGEIVYDDNLTKEVLFEEVECARRDKFDVLYLKGGTFHPDCLNDNFVLADEKVIYSQTICNAYPDSDNCVRSILHKELDARLLSMALQSGGYSRYYTDKRFSLDVFLNLYESWIARSLNGTIANDVLALIDHNTIEGFITYKIEREIVEIGLVVVDKSVKGKGIGSRLMRSFLSLFPVGTTIKVATQLRNSTACHFYEKNGFLKESVTNIYHIWL